MLYFAEVMFILSSTFSCLEFWLVNHTLIYESYESNVFKNKKIQKKYLTIDPKICSE